METVFQTSNEIPQEFSIPLTDIHQSTLIEMLEDRVHENPHKIAYMYLPQPPAISGPKLTYGELKFKAQILAKALLEQVQPGDRVLLVYDCNLDYVLGFYACLYANVIAVPVYPPTSPQHLGRLMSIVKDCQAKLSLTTEDLRGLSPAEVPCLCNENVFQKEVTGQTPKAFHFPPPTARQIAFLQYTSGSTGNPKGVMLSHENLLENLRMINRTMQLKSSDVIVTWLPLYHDMGLIGGILTPLSLGVTSHIMSPMNIVRPYKWLKAATDLKATLVAAPNFVFDLCCERISEEQKKTLDLSSIRLACCGAEPVRIKTMDKFLEQFKSCGFRAGVINPSYGLAEATLMVTSHVAGSALEQTSLEQNQLIGCGKPDIAQSVKIVSTNGHLMPAYQVGEIFVSGRNVAQGYWNQPELSKKTFQNWIDGKMYLRTGDLGFLDEKGELYVTGRCKELIIIRGKNYYPTDIEEAVRACHEKIRFAVAAAFSVDRDHEEQLVVAIEMPIGVEAQEAEQIKNLMQANIAEQHALLVYDIVMLRPGQVPRTSSGKIRRGACKERYNKRRFRAYEDNWRNTQIFKEAYRNYKKLRLVMMFQITNLQRQWLQRKSAQVNSNRAAN